MSSTDHPSPTDTPRATSAAGSRVRWIGRLVAVAVLLVTALALRDRWADLGTAPSWPHPGLLLAAIATNVVGNLLLIDAWRRAAGALSARLDMLLAADIWGSGQLARLLVPGASVAARPVLAARHGVDPGVGTLTTIVELAWTLIGPPLMAIATLPWWLPAVGDGLAWVVVPALVPTAVMLALLARPQPSLLLLASLMQRMPLIGGRLAGTAAALRDNRVTRSLLLGLLVRYIASSVVRVVGFIALAVGVVGAELALDAMPVLIGGYALGYVVGTIALFAPAGIGPREGVTAVILGPALGGTAALAMVALARLVEFVAELALLGVVRILRVRHRTRLS